MKRLLNTRDLCIAYRVSRSTLWRRIQASHIPAPTVINGRNYWLAETIEKHIAELMRGAI